MEYNVGKHYRLKSILRLNFIKTIVFNFRMFDFKTAVKMPVFLYGNVDVTGCVRGMIEFSFPVSGGGYFALENVLIR